MNHDDIELINKIIELTKKIYKIYNTLFELEINNQKESNLYSQNLNYLNMLLELEEELYKKIPINKIDSYLQYSDRANLFKNFSDFTLIINDFHDNYIYKRIYNRLHTIRKSYLIKIYQENTFNKTEPYFDLTNILYQTINEDMLNLFIYETNKLKLRINNTNYQNGFTMIKYIISFLNENIEKEYKNNFTINNKQFICNRIISDTFDISEEVYLNTLNYCYYYHIIQKEIQNISKKDLYTSDYAFENYRYLLQICFIKAFSYLIKDNIYLKSKIHDIINIDNIDDILNNNDDNIINIRSERLKVYGSSK